MKNIYEYLPTINATTAKEMAEQTGLDFTAIKAPLKYDYLDKSGNEIQPAIFPTPPNKTITVPDMVAVIREDDGTYLGTIGADRGILQYRDVLAFTEVLVNDGVASYVTGGFIKSGQQAFVVMKTSNAFKLDGQDGVDCYFYVTTSHNSRRSLEIVPAPLCQLNGTVITFNEDSRIRFKHSKHIEARVKRASASLSKVLNHFKEMETSFNLLRGIRINKSQFDLYMKMMVPDSGDRPKLAENIRADVEALYNNSPACRLPSTKGTMLGAYLAYIEYVDHVKNQRSSKVRPNVKEAKLFSLLEGTGAAAKADAYAFALQVSRQFGNVSFNSGVVEGTGFASL